MKYRVILEQDEDGVFVAEVPALPGCISQGPTRAAALHNIHEAIEGYLESLKAHDEPIPPSISEDGGRGYRVSVLPRISERQAVAAPAKLGYKKDRQKGSDISSVNL